MSDDPKPNALAGYNRELIDALMNPPKHEPWAWTKSMPMLAEFLRQGLQYAPLGFAARGPMPGPRFSPEHTVEAYHGSPAWNGDAVRTPFWMHEGKSVPRQFAGEKGSIVPVEADTSNYMRIPEGGWLDKFDQKFGHAGALERGTPNWLFPAAKALGRDGVRWDNSFHDYGPAMVAFDPRTVRGAGGGALSPRPVNPERAKPDEFQK